jgi:hypothetical protein
MSSKVKRHDTFLQSEGNLAGKTLPLGGTLSRARRRAPIEYRLDASGKVTYAIEGIPVASTLDRLWALLQLSLSLGSASGASTIDGDVVSHGKPTGHAPDGSSSFELRALERRWESCETMAARRSVLRDAVALYKQQTIPNADPSKKPGTREGRETIAHDPRSSREVAEMYGIGHATVCRYRREFLGRRRAEVVS